MNLRNKKWVFLILISICILSVVIWWNKAGNLPDLESSEVKNIKIWAGHENKFVQELSPTEDEEAINQIVEMYNGAKKVSSQDGTTPDAGMLITLKEGSEIKIWQLDVNRVTIKYKKQNGKDFSTNANSDIARYFREILSNAEIEG